MLFPLLLALATTPTDTIPGRVRGFVQSEPSGLPLAAAVVEVNAGPRTIATRTDSAGGYLLTVPSGRRTLRVRHLEHAPLEMEVLIPAGGEIVLDLAVRARPVTLPSLVATAGAHTPAGGDSAAPAPAITGMIEARTLEQGATAVTSAIGGGSGTRDGGAAPGDPRDVLVVRGSSADLKLILLDGAPVYAPFHMGGLIQSFEPEALRSARVYLGGAPARYDGALSYVLEMETRPGRTGAHRAAGAVDLISARTLFEGPIAGGASYLVSGRSVHGAVASRITDDPFPYRYADGIARIDVPIGGLVLGLTGFRNQEGVRVDTVGDGFARWSSSAGSLRLRGPVAGMDLEATAALSGFSALLPWTASGNRPISRRGSTERARFAADLGRRHGAFHIRFGGSVDRVWERQSAHLERMERDSLLLDRGSRADVAGVYLDGAWQSHPRIALRGGLRADAFAEGLVLAPRLAATWLPRETVALTLAGGRYFQHVRLRVPPARGPGSLADSLSLATELAPARATHLSAALDQQLTDRLRLGFEGHSKRFDGLPAPDENGAFTSGVDVWLRHAGERLTASAGYSLGWAWSTPSASRSGEPFHGRQLVNVGATGRFARGGRYGVRISYGAGVPFTTVGIPSTHPGELASPMSAGSEGKSLDNQPPPLAMIPDEAYLRVDADIAHTWTATWGGRTVHGTPYLRLLNALDRRDALFYRYDPSRPSAPVPLSALPVIPLLGFEWRF